MKRVNSKENKRWEMRPEYNFSNARPNKYAKRSLKMPVISMFYGIIIRMFNYDTQKHHQPHIHAQYQENNAVFAIETGDILTGKIPNRPKRLVQAWIEIHRDELFADWELAINGERVFQIRPLD